MSIRVCPLCQAEFLEFKTVCSHCGVALLDLDDDTDPRHLPPVDQLEYDLSGWPLDAQADAAQVLAESGIPHVWQGAEVLMPLIHEASADRLFEQLEQQYGLDGAGAVETGEDGQAPVNDGGETEYDMKAWATPRRMELVEKLVELSVPHRWEGDLLLVPTNLEDAVDDVLDEMEGSPGAMLDGDASDDDTDLADPADTLSGLFLAAERMRKGKVDVDIYADLLGCLDSSAPERPPYGFDPMLWQRVLDLGDKLADAVAEDHDDVEQLADELFQVLRPFV